MFGFSKKKHKEDTSKEIKPLVTYLNVVLLKLVTDELVIAKLLCSGSEPYLINGKYRLTDPYHVDIFYDNDGRHIYYDEWVPLTNTCLYDLSPDKVLSISIPVNGIRTSYIDCVDESNNEPCDDSIQDTSNVDSIINTILSSPYKDIKKSSNMF